MPLLPLRRTHVPAILTQYETVTGHAIWNIPDASEPNPVNDTLYLYSKSLSVDITLPHIFFKVDFGEKDGEAVVNGWRLR